MSVHTPNARDAALQRLSRANRWLIAGSLVLTGVLSDVAANAFAGKTIKSSSAAKRGAPSSSPGSSTPSRPLSPPAQAPRASESPPASESSPSQEQAPSPEAPPPAVSGGS